MKRLTQTLTTVSLSLVLSSHLAWSAPRTQIAAEKPEELTLALALAKAHRNNPTLYARRLTQELREIEFDNAWARMFLPQISLNATGLSPFTIAQLAGTQASAIGSGALEHGTPSAGSTISIGQYDLFNFGKDRDRYDIARLEVERTRQNVHEVERQVRFETIAAVFNLKTQQDLLDVAHRSVEAARAVFELVRSRVASGRAQSAELASIEADLLTAKNALIAAQTSYSQALWALNVVLGDPLDHPYNVRSGIKYIKFKMPLEDAVRVFKENSPLVREARKNLEQARLTMKLAEKNALPLPTVTFSGITVGRNFTSAGTTSANDTSPGNGNVNLSAQLNFSIPLVGDGGFLNGRALRAAEINEELAELRLINAGNYGEANVRGLYTKVIQAENLIENNERLFKDSLKVFEAALSALQTRGQVSRLDMRDAIARLREAELAFTRSVLDHYNYKLELANAIGVDRFPEENL